MRGWSAVISTKPRGHVEIETEEDEIPYQCDDMSPVLPITHDLLHGLADEALIEEVEEVIVPIVQVGNSEDEEEEEEQEDNDGEDGENAEEDEDEEYDEYEYME